MSKSNEAREGGKFAVRDYITTSSGMEIRHASMTEQDVRLDDIAHALSLLCRFGGHIKKFYSVAEHSVRCYWMAVDMYGPDSVESRAALFHDAQEAYLVDIPSPLKAMLPDYRVLETRIERLIRRVFQLPEPNSLVWDRVKRIDREACAVEARNLLDVPPTWAMDAPLLTIRFGNCWSPEGAERAFLAIAADLGYKP